jgi:hypothetical protein
MHMKIHHEAGAVPISDIMRNGLLREEESGQTNGCAGLLSRYLARIISTCRCGPKAAGLRHRLLSGDTLLKSHGTITGNETCNRGQKI